MNNNKISNVEEITNDKIIDNFIQDNAELGKIIIKLDNAGMNKFAVESVVELSDIINDNVNNNNIKIDTDDLNNKIDVIIKLYKYINDKYKDDNIILNDIINLLQTSIFYSEDLPKIIVVYDPNYYNTDIDTNKEDIYFIIDYKDNKPLIKKCITTYKSNNNDEYEYLPKDKFIELDMEEGFSQIIDDIVKSIEDNNNINNN